MARFHPRGPNAGMLEWYSLPSAALWPCLTSCIAFMTIAGVVRFTEPALSLAPHSVGAHRSVSGLSLMGGAGCCAFMRETPTTPRIATTITRASTDRLPMCGLHGTEVNGV